ncbi:MAG: energy transducer TonB [Sandaracinaceae bacterium]|nr:energy transducer TonB [Sandaracinaceae bacterium]
MSTGETQRWGIAASAPPVDPAEIETHERAVEVVVMWGDSVLCVEHVSPPRDVMVETVGEAIAPFPAVVERDGRLLCVVPAGATGAVYAGDATRTFAELASQGALTPFDGLEGASLYALPEGASARVEHAGLSVLVRPTHAARTVTATGAVPWRRYVWIGASIGVHALVLVMFYFLPPSSSALSLDAISAQDRMVQYLDSARANEPEPPVTWEDRADDGAPGDPGRAHAGETGDSGREDAPQTNRRFAIQGNERDRALSRENLRETMAERSIIGTVATVMGAWNVPTSPFGADRPRGDDAMNAIGEMLGDQAGDSFGRFGLGMLGTGRGAGGDGLGTYGVGQLGTIGTCRGTNCTGGHGPGGYGSRAGTLRERRGITVGPMDSSAQVLGGLSRDAIRRVVRRNLPQVRHCYEQGLTNHPSLEGRVVVSWTVDSSGTVQRSEVAQSTLGNAGVESCIASAVRRWTFPQPDGGMPVGVNYPFMLQSPD